MQLLFHYLIEVFQICLRFDSEDFVKESLYSFLNLFKIDIAF